MRNRDSLVYTPVSLGPDTDDEDTLVNEEIYNKGKIRFFYYLNLAIHWWLVFLYSLVDIEVDIIYWNYG